MIVELKKDKAEIEENSISTLTPDRGFTFALIFSADPTNLFVNDKLVSGTINAGKDNRAFIDCVRVLLSEGSLKFNVPESGSGEVELVSSKLRQC